MLIAKSLLLFALAAVAEIGGAWPDASFGRILAAYGGVFVAGLPRIPAA